MLARMLAPRRVKSRLAAESQAGQMMLAISAMLVPALFFRVVAQESHQERLIHPVSLGVSVVLWSRTRSDSSSRFARIATG